MTCARERTETVVRCSWSENFETCARTQATVTVLCFKLWHMKTENHVNDTENSQVPICSAVACAHVVYIFLWCNRILIYHSRCIKEMQFSST